MNELNVTESRVLIVDDVDAHLEVLVDALSGEYDVLVATNGADALTAVLEDQPDLILLDIVMPDMDGYEVCRRLKADSRTRDIPVIFITVLAEVNHEQKGLDLGAVDYIHKPFSPALVKARVRCQLRLRASSKALQRQNQELVEAAALREQLEQVACHDLKNPLTSILTLPRLVMDLGGLTPEQRMWLERTEAAGLRMLQQINFTLDLFRIERGLYELPQETVNLVQVARNTVRDQFSSLSKRQQKVDLFIDGRIANGDDAMIVRGEELLLYSLVGNLLKNASEASPEGETITVSLGAATGILSIRNRGAVPQEIRDRFFGKLVTAGKNRGHGLGTYSARLVTELHGGRISVDFSEPGHTTVTCTFPGS